MRHGPGQSLAATALVRAGQKELASKLSDEAEKHLGEDAKKALEGLLGGK